MTKRSDPSKPILFQPVGYCIYCGAKSTILTDEHIVPESLYGLDILPKATCKPCEQILTNVDGYLARHVFYKLRLRVGIKTKKHRRNSHPEKLVATGYRNSNKIEIVTSRTDHPFFLTMPVYQRPAILFGRPPSDIYGFINIINLAFFPDGAKQKLGEKDGDLIGFSQETKINPYKFARGIAKIAYASFVANCGRDAIEDALILPLILGNDVNAPYLVGSPSQEKFPWDEMREYHWFKFDLVKTPNKLLIIVRLRLFAPFGSANGIGLPIYEVVLGTPSKDFVRRALGPIQ